MGKLIALVVVAAVGVGGWLYLRSDPARVTFENVQKIKMGMTETQVRQILGRPSSWWGDPQVWEGKEGRTVKITFSDGRVQLTEYTGPDIQQYLDGRREERR